MKKLSLLLLTLTLCFFTACHKDIWAELENLDQRVTKLEELCKEMNTNITSLQTIVSVLQSNDYITGIIEIKKNGEVIGYTITFGKHDPITIYLLLDFERRVAIGRQWQQNTCIWQGWQRWGERS